MDFDSVHNVYMPQFLIVLRRYLFPPACLAFKHALEGALFNFEKLLLSEAFFHMFRKLLPERIPNSELFAYTPYVFCWLFGNGDHTSTENACYEIAEFNDRLNTSSQECTTQEQAPSKYFVNPVRLITDTLIRGASDRFVLMEYEEARSDSRLTQDDYQRQIDLFGLLLLLKHSGANQENNDPIDEEEIFETYSADYTLWVPNANTNLLPIANVSEQTHNLQRFTDNDMEDIKQQLSTNDLYSIFTFADPSKLSKHNHAQLILLKSGNIVYISGLAKNNANWFLCFDPADRIESFVKTDTESVDNLARHSYVVIRENVADIRKIEQITCVLLDISGSMHILVGKEGDQHSLLELSTMALGAWRDRLTSYRLPHALGLICFGADDESPAALELRSRFTRAQLDVRIVVRCDITRDFSSFERALASEHECGYDTPLYDAINVAIQKIRSFREKAQSRLSPTCKDLIICVTDGADTCSKTSQSDVLGKLLSHKIVFDAINFDTKQNEALIDFCEKTKGYYYGDIPHDQESMLSLFELEATISMQDRDENIHGKIKYPQRRQPMLLDKPAIASKQARISDGRASNISLRRIMLEINNLNKADLKNFELFVSKENLFFWKMIMYGETGTPYSDGHWLLFIEFPPMYPQQPPEIRFITKIYHCNINDDGKICHDILSTAWSQKTSMRDVFMELLRLLREPNADDALSSMKGAQYKASRENYDNTIIEWKHLYASASIEELKARYSLE